MDKWRRRCRCCCFILLHTFYCSVIVNRHACCVCMSYIFCQHLNGNYYACIRLENGPIYIWIFNSLCDDAMIVCILYIWLDWFLLLFYLLSLLLFGNSIEMPASKSVHWWFSSSSFFICEYHDDDDDDEFDYAFIQENYMLLECCVALSNLSNHSAITSSPRRSKLRYYILTFFYLVALWNWFQFCVMLRLTFYFEQIGKHATENCTRWSFFS